MILSNNTNNINIEINLGNVQSNENMAIIPLKSTQPHVHDLITLKKGLKLELVEVKECEESTVNTISIINNSVTPLILIDGEEIVGSKQNRIINSTIIVAPKSTANIPVSCTERGRWHHTTPTFKQLEHIANFNTRLKKENARRVSENYQNVIWDSIDELEIEQSFKSPTSARCCPLFAKI